MDKLALEKFREGLEELLFVEPYLGAIARSMGTPVFDYSCPTASLSFENDSERIVFQFNPEFIDTLSNEMVAAVIAHETHHLVLDHLNEMMDRKIFPQTQALIKAQECIINDTLETVYEMVLPDFVLRGPDLLGEDCTPYSTKQVYDKFVDEELESEGDGDNAETDSNGSKGASGATTAESDENAGESDSEGSAGNEADHVDGACGGINVPAEDFEKFVGNIDKIFEAAADSLGIDKEELEQELSNTAEGGGYSLFEGGGQADAHLSDERMAWRELLAAINPKIKEIGGPKKQYRNNWARPNMRMVSVYPQVILPTSEPLSKDDDRDGDDVPVFVIALDLSGSIPRELVKTLQGLLRDIPEDLIKAFPCTWSTSLVPFDSDNPSRICSSMGTRIDLVKSYVDKIRDEENVDPYVLVITDGGFHQNWGRSDEKWFYMGIDNNSVDICVKHHTKHPENIYNVNEFRVA